MLTDPSAGGAELVRAVFWLAADGAWIDVCPGTDKTGTSNHTDTSNRGNLNAIFMKRFSPLDVLSRHA
jgi:hypothetical protein